jgi:short-subunit dehydrogenase
VAKTTGQTALVTGATSGIGRAFADLLAAEGTDLVLVARSEERLRNAQRELAAAHGVEVVTLCRDLADPAAVEDVHRTLAGQGRRVDLLVNNAGLGRFGPFVQSSWPAQMEMIRVNVVALTHLARLFAADMVARGRGTILNVASTAAFKPGPSMAVYYATKAYVLSLSCALAAELRGTGVSVTALCPGPTDTGFDAAAGVVRVAGSPGRGGASPADVARYGLCAARRGRQVAVPGARNRVLAAAARHMPLPLSAALVGLRRARRARGRS